MISEYGRVMMNLSWFVMQKFWKKNGDYEIPLVDEQMRLCKALVGKLEKGENAVGELQNLFYSLFAFSEPKAHQDLFACTIMCFVCLYCLKRDGQFEEAHNCTRIFAMLTRGMRITFYFKILEKEKDYVGPDMLL